MEMICLQAREIQVKLENEMRLRKMEKKKKKKNQQQQQFEMKQLKKAVMTADCHLLLE